MAIEAPTSKFRKTNIKLYILVCIALAFWCAYDGYYNKEWINKHTNPNGTQQTYLTVNRNAPFGLAATAVLLGAYLFIITNRKIIAGDTELTINGKKKISYDSIEKIDKTHFKKKGYFIITYNDSDNNNTTQDCKISDKSYDNLNAVLDIIIEKIS